MRKQNGFVALIFGMLAGAAGIIAGMWMLANRIWITYSDKDRIRKLTVDIFKEMVEGRDVYTDYYVKPMDYCSDSKED